MPAFRICANYYFFGRRQSIWFDQDESSATEITRFDDGKSTQQFLAQFQVDRYAMDGLRGLLSESRRWLDVSRLTGDQVLAEVARLILAGEIGVALRPHSFYIGSSATPVTGEMTQLPAAAPVNARKSEEPESPTFSPSLNAVLQAAALALAAASGAAFCPH
jgi:hypothetical protein